MPSVRTYALERFSRSQSASGSGRPRVRRGVHRRQPLAIGAAALQRNPAAVSGLSAVARAAGDEARERHPEATVRLDADSDLGATVLGSTGVRTALDELLKDSLEHGGSAVDVGVYVSPAFPRV